MVSSENFQLRLVSIVILGGLCEFSLSSSARLRRPVEIENNKETLLPNNNESQKDSNIDDDLQALDDKHSVDKNSRPIPIKSLNVSSINNTENLKVEANLARNSLEEHLKSNVAKSKNISIAKKHSNDTSKKGTVKLTKKLSEKAQMDSVTRTTLSPKNSIENPTDLSTHNSLDNVIPNRTLDNRSVFQKAEITPEFNTSNVKFKITVNPQQNTTLKIENLSNTDVRGNVEITSQTKDVKKNDPNGRSNNKAEKLMLRPRVAEFKETSLNASLKSSVNTSIPKSHQNGTMEVNRNEKPMEVENNKKAISKEELLVKHNHLAALLFRSSVFDSSIRSIKEAAKEVKENATNPTGAEELLRMVSGEEAGGANLNKSHGFKDRSDVNLQSGQSQVAEDRLIDRSLEIDASVFDNEGNSFVEIDDENITDSEFSLTSPAKNVTTEANETKGKDEDRSKGFFNFLKSLFF